MMILPYGDTLNDGAVQLSFTLPIKHSARAMEAARQLVLKLGFNECQIVHASPLAEEFTFFVAYGKTAVGIDPAKVHVEVLEEDHMSFNDINDYIRTKIDRKIVVIGACTGFDAHTVGIDAIMNMKGYNHHFGLERYPMIEAHNLGAQVSNETLIAKARQLNADAILISQVVTQKNTHIHNLTNFAELLEAEHLRDSFILIVGGPRISHNLALEVGFDAGFGPGTYAEHVASFIAKRMVQRKEQK
jgi:beta-lysine 5,6-aminomutase beta subunit